MDGLDLDAIRHALKVARRHGLTEVELCVGETRFSARLAPMPVMAPPVHTSSAAESAAIDLPSEPDHTPITAGLVGFFRVGKTKLEIGQTVEAGQSLGAIAALGISSEVECPVSGEIVEVLIQPDAPVEFGQVLARVKAE